MCPAIGTVLLTLAVFPPLLLSGPASALPLCSPIGATQACTTEGGQTGTQTCEEDYDVLGRPAHRWGDCVAGPGTSQPEECDGLDNDLDGIVDNAPGQGANTLTRPYSNPDQCAQNGTERCTGPNTWSAPTGCGGSSATTCPAATAGVGCSPPKAQCNDACVADTAACTDLLWCGDFGTGDLAQYKSQQCQARVKPDGGSNAASCPNGVQSVGDNIVAGMVDCPNPQSDVGCRFALVQPPAPDAGVSSTFQPPGPALRVRVAPSPDPSKPDLGDSGSNMTPAFPNGKDHRNELAKTREPSTTGFSGEYSQNDDRYYGWSTFLPAVNDPNGGLPLPGAFTGSSSYAWKILMQFHSIGECDSGGPNLSVGLKRNDASGPNNAEKGGQYQWVLFKRDKYWNDNASSLTDLGQYAPSKALGFPGNYRLWPFNNDANDFPSSNAVQQGRWYTFVLHVRWSVCDCAVGQTCAAPKIACQAGSPQQEPGVVELWVDGQLVYPITTGTNPDPATRPTLYTWPGAAAYQPATATQPAGNLALYCPNRNAESPRYSANAPMPVYLKTGIYRKKYTSWVDTLYHADLVVGRTRAAVDPLTRPR